MPQPCCGKMRIRRISPASILLIVGFTISATSVLIGVSAVDAILQILAESDGETPIYLTMQNTGLSLAAAIYVFSVANCLVVTNCWMITKQREMAIRKAFGWTNRKLVSMIIREMAKLLAAGLILSILLVRGLRTIDADLFGMGFSLFFLSGTVGMLLLTLAFSLAIPLARILKIHPAEVIS